MVKVLVLLHAACEKPGIIADVLKSQDISLEYIHTSEGQPAPRRMGGAAGLIVMGGPMGVYERARYPFLSDEMRLIESALQEDKPILGVCLGSQLLAATLGAAVTQGKRKEIGWYPITLTESANDDALWKGVQHSFTAFHWHGDVFDLPRDAVSLASSKRTACQAFRYRSKAYGILFHMETTAEILRDMIKAFEEEFQEAGLDGGEVGRHAAGYLSELQTVGKSVFERWAGLTESSG